MATDTTRRVDWLQRPGLVLAEAIKEQLDHRGMSVPELAKQIGCSRGYLNQLLRGDVPPPSEGFVLRLAEHFGLDEANTDRWLYFAGRIRTARLAQVFGTESFLRALHGATGGALSMDELKDVTGRLIERLKA